MVRVNVFPGVQNLPLFALRAEIKGQWDGKLPAPEKYCDLRYYQHALETLM